MKGIDLCDSARNLARLITSRHTLTPPVDIIAVLSLYAEIEEVEIPFSFDGIALNIKAGGRAKVILNSKIPASRRRFTAAHELGHVVIPWHRGIFFDDESIDNSERWANVDAYIEMERQANAFASEILMPRHWIKELLSGDYELAQLHYRATSGADVSAMAAAINICQSLPPGCIYAAVDSDGIVVNSGRSDGTHAATPTWKKPLPENSYSYATEKSILKIGGYRYTWWRLPTEFSIESSTDAATDAASDWRSLLDEIVLGIDGMDTQSAKNFKSRVNGVVAFANGACKREGKHTKGAVFAAAMQRFNDRPEYSQFAMHPKFKNFLNARINSFLNPSG